MFRARTLLILGAGASCPFGFPLGAGLREALCHLTRLQNKSIGIIRREGFDDGQIQHFQERFAKSLLPIDNFVARQPQFDEIARLAIAAVLLPSEEESHLYGVRKREDEHRTVVNGTADWHQLLWRHMLDGVREPADLAVNSLKVITFNYDRSFEHFIRTTTESSFGLDSEQALRLVDPFFPYHMYGQLGPYTGPDALPYGGTRTADGALQGVKRAASSLKLMPSTRPDADERCTAFFDWAEQVFFLGFAFDEMNCERLGLLGQTVIRNKLQKPQLAVYGTNYGLDAHESSEAAARVHTSPMEVSLAPVTCLEAVRQWMPAFSRRSG